MKNISVPRCQLPGRVIISQRHKFLIMTIPVIFQKILCSSVQGMVKSSCRFQTLTDLNLPLIFFHGFVVLLLIVSRFWFWMTAAVSFCIRIILCIPMGSDTGRLQLSCSKRICLHQPSVTVRNLLILLTGIPVPVFPVRAVPSVPPKKLTSSVIVPVIILQYTPFKLTVVKCLQNIKPCSLQRLSSLGIQLS